MERYCQLSALVINNSSHRLQSDTVSELTLGVTIWLIHYTTVFRVLLLHYPLIDSLFVSLQLFRTKHHSRSAHNAFAGRI